MTVSCGTWSVTSTTPDGELIALPLRCRSWSCPHCAPRLKRKLKSRLSLAPANTLITLTCRPRLYTYPEEAFAAMSAAIPHLFKRLRRRLPGQQLEYALFWELTEAGWPHAHILFRGPFIPKPWLLAAWLDLTGAFIVDVRALHSTGEVVSYVAKYISKKLQVPFGCKRYRFSRHFLDEAAGLDQVGLYSGLFWTMTPLSLCDLAQLWDGNGFGVHYGLDGALTANHVPPVQNLETLYVRLAAAGISRSSLFD